MFLTEIIILSLAIISGLVSTSLVIARAKSSPIPEMKLLAISLLLYTLGFVCYLLSVSIIAPLQAITYSGIVLYRIGSFIITISLLLTYLVLILPNFRIDYNQLLQLSAVSSLFIITAMLNLNIELKINNDRLLIIVSPFTVFLIFFCLAILLTTFFSRIYQINKHRPSTESPFNSFKALILVLALTIVVSFSITIPWLFPKSFLPTFTSGFFASLLFLVFSYSFYRDEAFLFITPANLDAVIISFKQTGLTLYSKNWKLKSTPEELLCSIFTWMNISLKETIQNPKDIKEVRYGDKVVLIENGLFTTTFFITTSKNFITLNLSKYINNNFERKYFSVLRNLNHNQMIQKDIFNDINVEIRYAKKILN